MLVTNYQTAIIIINYQTTDVTNKLPSYKHSKRYYYLVAMSDKKVSNKMLPFHRRD